MTLLLTACMSQQEFKSFPSPQLVYITIALALPAAAAVLHGRDGLRFRQAKARQIDSRFHPAKDQ